MKDYVYGVRQRQRVMFVPLAHPPGHAQVDFGEALAVIGGVERKIHILAMDSRKTVEGWRKHPEYRRDIRLCWYKKNPEKVTTELLARLRQDGTPDNPRPDERTENSLPFTVLKIDPGYLGQILSITYTAS